MRADLTRSGAGGREVVGWRAEENENGRDGKGKDGLAVSVVATEGFRWMLEGVENEGVELAPLGCSCPSPRLRDGGTRFLDNPIETGAEVVLSL